MRAFTHSLSAFLVLAASSAVCVSAAEPAQGQPWPLPTPAAEDELFDSHLLKASASQMPQGSPCVDNCTPPPAIPSMVAPSTPDQIFSGDGAIAPVPPMPGSSMTPSPMTNPSMNNTFNQPQSNFAPQNNFSGSGNGVSAGQGQLMAQNDVPGFLSDFFGGPATSTNFSGINGSFNTALPTSTGTSGVLKLAEGASPVPRDRVFVSYNYFSNVDFGNEAFGVNRLVAGGEKTFFDGRASVEVRVPMAWTASNDFGAGGEIESDSYQLGNITTFFKLALVQTEDVVVSTGLGVSLPTANDIRVKDLDGITLALLNNQSVHVLPFLGTTAKLTDRWYVQGLTQLDIATNGNSLFTSINDSNLTLRKVGVLQDATFLFTSVGTGYWIYKSADPNERISGISPFVEMHFNQSLQSQDFIDANNSDVGSVQVGRDGIDIQTINAVVGVNTTLGRDASLMLGYVAPVGGAKDQVFDGEFRLLFNWFYGNRGGALRNVQF